MSNPDKLYKIRHSLAHILASAVLHFYPRAKLGVGPVTENGFFYDFLLDKPIGQEDLKKIESKMRELLKKNLDFKKQVLTIPKAKEFFRKLKQPFKTELIEDIQKYGTTKHEKIKNQKRKVKSQRSKVKTVTLYHTGEFVDLCRGGHIKNTSQINPEAFKLEKTAGAYWRGNEKNPQLIRIYGLAFKSKKELEDHLKLQKEFEKRDHRLLGPKLGLFMFHPLSPGIPFYLPKGTIVRNELEKFVREVSYGPGYSEVRFPQLFDSELWKISGHWDHFKDDMFVLKVDERDFALKPMNCPAHMLYFSSRHWSYRDLPLRLAEITTLFRNEISGALGGLTRVRAFGQDDTHIFLTPEQVENEVSELLGRIKKIYQIFDLELQNIALSTRPKKALGSKQDWDKAEKSLAKALKKANIKFEVAKGEGAFYGPKIDIKIKDALSREWQLATVQLDLQMPKRFGLEYVDRNGKRKTPLVIHRAILGAFERFLGVIIEHYAGAFPFWLAPVQVAVLPITVKHEVFAQKLVNELKNRNIRAEFSQANETLSKRVMEYEEQKIPYLVVIGDREIQNNSVALRARGKKNLGEMKVKELMEKFVQEIKDRI